MGRLRLLAVLTGFLALAVPSNAGVLFQFDELGNLGFSLNSGPFTPMPNGVVAPDPTAGVSGNVLIYDLTSELNTFSLLTGDVPVGPAVGGGIIGDLRFTDPAGQLTGNETCGTVECLMIFYVFDSNGLPADVGFISTNFLTTQTPGTLLGSGTLPNSFLYTAGVLSYQGTIVPEPAPAVMFLFGLITLAYFWKRSKRLQTT